MSVRRMLPAVVCLALLAPSPAAAAVPERKCSTRAEGGSPSRQLARPNDVRIGPVAFTGLKRHADPNYFALARGRGGRYTVKAAAGVLAGRVVTVSIAPGSRGVAGLTFARRSPFGGVPAVRFFACDKDQRAATYDGRVGVATGYPGGFSLAGPSCVDIVVRQRGRSAPWRRTVPFGTGTCR